MDIAQNTSYVPIDGCPVDAIERAAAVQTVEQWGVDAVWVAPTERGARLRASVCLATGRDPADVLSALERWSP